MSTRALLFPGQGAQTVGMGKDFYDAYPAARDCYEQACEAVGVDLIKLSFEGPQDELNKTDICQPAILTASIAMLEALKVEAKTSTVQAAFTAGLSLGEYTSLVFAGAISFVDGVRLVRQRGLYMMEACKQFPSSMASVLGLSREDCDAACREASSAGIITVANVNSPGQIVISGELKALELASELCKARGAGRVIPLAVSGAFHSQCMAPAGKSLGEEIDGVDFRNAAIPVIANVSGKPNTEKDALRQALKDQLTSPVEWVASMETAVAKGVTQVLEVGPGRVLCGLMKKINRDTAATGVFSVESMTKALSEGLVLG